MVKKISCILVAFVMIFCLSFGNFAGVTVFADEEEYSEITTSSKVLTSGTYKLTSDVTLKNYLQINSGVEVTLDLNGYELSASADQTIYIYGGVLNLIDSSTDDTGSVESAVSSSSACCIRLAKGGTLNMQGGTVCATSYCIYAKSGVCVINITGGSISSTKYTALCYKGDSGGSVTISGTDRVEILSESLTNDMYGIYSTDATLTISNPNTYVSASSTNDAVKATASKADITAGHYSTDVSSYVTSEGYSCNETDDADYPYVVTADVVELETDEPEVDEPEVALPSLYGETLTLDGSIGVTFYFDMTDVSDPNLYTLTAKIGEDGEEQSVTAGKTKTIDGIEYYRYTVYVNPDEFNTAIYVSLTDGTNTTDTYSYSVYAYCIYAINNDWDESDLCKALLNYGDYACAYDSGISTCSLDSVAGWTDPVTEEWSVDLSSYSGTETPGVAKTILLGSTVAIRLYMTSDAASESDEFTANGDVLELYPVDDENYSYYVEFKVTAKDMVNTFTVLKNGEEFTSYSVLSYVKNVIEAENADTALSNLCKAIYYYSLAANEYTGWQ